MHICGLYETIWNARLAHGNPKEVENSSVHTNAKAWLELEEAANKYKQASKARGP